MKIAITFFPEFDEVFDKVDELARYVFLPLISISIKDNLELYGKKFHVVSLWDTGDYETSYFNEYRREHWIRFDYSENKYSYPAPIEFPSSKFLKQAFKIAKSYFYENIDFYLMPKSDAEFSHIEDGKKGGAIIRESLPEMPEFDSQYYFRRIVSYFLTKERMKRHLILNSRMVYSFFGDEGRTREEIRDNFNQEGKVDFESFRKKPDHTTDELIPQWGLKEDQEFICHVDVGEFIHREATLITLFYDKNERQVIHSFSWD